MLVLIIDGKFIFELVKSRPNGRQKVAVAFGQIEHVNLHAFTKASTQVRHKSDSTVASIPRVQGMISIEISKNADGN